MLVFPPEQALASLFGTCLSGRAEKKTFLPSCAPVRPFPTPKPLCSQTISDAVCPLCPHTKTWPLQFPPKHPKGSLPHPAPRREPSTRSPASLPRFFRRARISSPPKRHRQGPPGNHSNLAVLKKHEELDWFHSPSCPNHGSNNWEVYLL